MHFFRVYLMPGMVFVSVVIGGGYGTGREIVEYFTSYGLRGGIYGMGVSLVLFALVIFCTFEFARRFQVYDYRQFFQALIGPFWRVVELLYVVAFFLVLGVVSAAAGDLAASEFGIPVALGLVIMMGLVALLVVFGREVLERALAAWCVFMLVVFLLYFAYTAGADPTLLNERLTGGDVVADWYIGGTLYPLYNVALAPVLLYAARDIGTSGQSLGAAIVAACLTMLPVLLFHSSFSIGYPEVLDQGVPNYWLLDQFGEPWLKMAFLVALFGTLAQTGAGLVHGVIERIESVLVPDRDDGLGKLPRAAIAVVALIASAMLGSLGIIAIIGAGYSAMALCFALFYVLPVCTVGIYRALRTSAQ